MSNLSPREKEALRLLSIGKSKPEMAEYMGISLGTTHGYIRSIHKKLQTHNAVTTVRRGVELGLIPCFCRPMGGNVSRPEDI